MGWKYLHKELSQHLSQTQAFYYLVHPADFICATEINAKKCNSLERMNVDLSVKMDKLREVFQELKRTKRPVTNMQDLANHAQRQMLLPNA